MINRLQKDLHSHIGQKAVKLFLIERILGDDPTKQELPALLISGSDTFSSKGVASISTDCLFLTAILL